MSTSSSSAAHPYVIAAPFACFSAANSSPEPVHDSFQELMTAFEAVESDDAAARFQAIDTWVAGHGDVNKDVILPARSKNALPDNRGSPLLIASEMDYAPALAALVARGADVNYRHPASHGGAPLLRCAEMGYDECLAVLLSTDHLDVEVVTKEYKLVLGQNFPQYEAGGRNALLLAVESCRLGSVELLLGHSGCRSKLLAAKDSFGRTPLEAAFEKATLKGVLLDATTTTTTTTTTTATTTTTSPILAIIRLLCAAEDRDFNEAKAALAPASQAEALARWRERNVELRRRFLKTSHAKREASAAVGRAAVAAHYEIAGRRRHPEVYTSSFSRDALLLHQQQQQQQGAAAVAAAEEEEEEVEEEVEDPIVRDVSEPLPGVLHFPLLTKEHCAKLYEELQHYEATAHASEQDPAAVGGRLPLYVRHDGNLGALQDCGFEPLLRAVEQVLRQVVKKHLPSNGANDCEVYHAFLTRNWVGRDENATFKIHCDKSDLTFNLCLHASDDMEGSTVGFYEQPPNDGETPTEALRRHTLVHRVGHAAVHDGAAWHKTDPITQGTRASLIVWARLTGSPCAACGASTGATWLFCKACGKEIAGR